jgi:hypothetical protein
MDLIELSLDPPTVSVQPIRGRVRHIYHQVHEPERNPVRQFPQALHAADVVGDPLVIVSVMSVPPRPIIASRLPDLIGFRIKRDQRPADPLKGCFGNRDAGIRPSEFHSAHHASARNQIVPEVVRPGRLGRDQRVNQRVERVVAQRPRLFPSGQAGALVPLVDGFHHVGWGQRVQPVELDMKTTHALKQVHDPPEPAPGLRVEGFRGRNLARIGQDRTQEKTKVAI